MTKRRLATLISAPFALFLWTHSNTAFAADPTAEERALSTTLFSEAKLLMNDGKLAEACPKFAESQRLVPAGGTLLNLATCHAQEGKTATAWSEYRDARVMAGRDRRDDRVTFIDEQMKDLEPKLSRLTIHVAPAADIANIEVNADGHPVRRPAWDTAFPVDPGEHVVEATAPGKKLWRAHVAVLANADTKVVSIEAWEQADPTVLPALVRSSTTRTANGINAERAPPAERSSRLRPSVIMAGIGGIGGLLMGSYFGLRAIAKHNQSDDACTSDPCGERSTGFNDDAKTAADVSTIAFAVGIVGLGLATYFWFADYGSPTKTKTSSGGVLHPGRDRLHWMTTF